MRVGGSRNLRGPPPAILQTLGDPCARNFEDYGCAMARRAARASVRTGRQKKSKIRKYDGSGLSHPPALEFCKKGCFIFSSTCFPFLLGQSVGCIRPNKKLEKDKHVRARRRIGQKTARFFSLTSCALLAWEEPALYKVQRKV